MTRFDIDFGFETEPKGKTPSLIKQVHGTRVVAHEKLMDPVQEADGILTHSKNTIYVFTADCLPVLLFSEHQDDPVVAVHAGWRGAKDGIVKHGLDFFEDPAAAHIIFGPSLGPCCFEVKEDFIEAFGAKHRAVHPYLKEKKGRQYFSLIDFIIGEDLRDIPPENLHREHFRCTYCSKPQLPSYRRNKGTDPRLRSWIRKR